MRGRVDSQLRALIRVQVAPDKSSERREIEVWIDTAFNGGLTIPRMLINDLRLTQESATEAVLANGVIVELETFGCWFDWFGKSYYTQVVASDGPYPLLGTMLLAGRRLLIDYGDSAVELS